MLHVNKAKTFVYFLTSLFEKPWVLIAFLVLFPHLSYGGIGDGLTDKEKNILFKALKKISIRLTEMETQNFKSMQESQNRLQETQGLILMHIQDLQKIVPQMQGTIEQNQAALEERIAILTAEINQTRFQGQKDRNQIKSEWKILREQVNSQLEMVSKGIAQDIETFEKENKQFIEGMHNTNKETLGKVIASVNRQNARLSESQKVIKEDLIPAIGQQNQKNRDAMNASLKMIQDPLAKTETKIQGVIGILQKSFNTQKTANASFQKQLNTLNNNQKKANANITTTSQAIYDIRDALNQQLPALAKNQNTITTLMDANQKQAINNMKIIDDNTRKVAEGVKVLGSNFNNLGQSVNTLHANVAKLEEQSKSHAEKLMGSNQLVLEKISQTILQTMTQVDQNMRAVGQAEEKLTTIIEILEIRSQQSGTLDAKLDESEQSMQENQDNIELANQKLIKLIEILKTLVSTQAKIEQSLQQQSEIFQTRQSLPPPEQLDQLKANVDRLSNDQVGIKGSLADLKRKANVNISRNNDIKKSQKEIRKSLKQLLSHKNPAAKQ